MLKRSSPTLGLLVALLLIYALTLQSFPLQRGVLVLAKDDAAKENKANASTAERNASTQPQQSDAKPLPAPQPLEKQRPNAPNVVSMSATLRDSFPNHGDGKAHQGDTITYSVAITNSGDTAATGVQYSDTVEVNTSTLVAGSPAIQFTLTGDTYSAIGNVRLNTSTIGGAGQHVTDNDTLNGATLSGFGATLANANGTVPNGTNTVTTSNGGTVTMNADGSFTYNPAAGFGGAGVTDSFWYTLTKNMGTGNPTGFPSGSARVTINVSAPIWFVNQAAAAGGNGRLTTPFNCLTGAGCFSAVNDGAAGHPKAGDAVFLYKNPTPPAAFTGGVTLLNNQKLIGEGASASLASILGISVPAGSDPLPATGNAPPVITTVAASTNGINLAVGASATLRGFTIGNTTGFKIASGANFGTLTTSEVLLNGTGGALSLTSGILAATFTSITSTSSANQGINLAGVSGSMTATGGTTISGNSTQCILIGTTTADINFGNTSCTGGTDGVSLQNNANAGHVLTFGTLNVSGGTGTAFLHSAGGGNVTVTGAATLSSAGSAVSVSSPTNTNAINFQAATSATSTGSGNAGVNWVGTAGATITFNALTIQTNAGTGLNATTGGTVNVTNATGTINNTSQAAAAIIANAVALNANFSTIKSSGGTNGVSLTNVTGTSNFGSGSLSGASGGTFLVNGSTGIVTYNGTITQGNAARVVDIQNKTGGTITLGGAVSSTGGTGTGIILNSNTGATITFTGGIALTTNVNAAFTATGGGTVAATQNNTTIVNTLTTTTGTALNVANTTIGASGLTFRSISSNGASSGIVLNNTGSSGGLTISGNGGTCTSVATCTGGAIQGATGAADAVSLTSTSNFSATKFIVTGGTHKGVGGTSVNGFALTDSQILNNGSAGGSTDNGVNLIDTTGAVSFTNVTATGNKQSNVELTTSNNSTAKITTISVTGGSYSNSPTDDGFLVDLHSSAIGANAPAIGSGLFSGVTFSGNLAKGLQLQQSNDATIGDGSTPPPAGAPGGTPNGSITVTGCTFSTNNVAASLEGGGGTGGTGSVYYRFINNGSAASPILGIPTTTPGTGSSHAVNFANGSDSSGGTYRALISNNFIGNPAVVGSGSAKGDGIRVFMQGQQTATVTVLNNTVRACPLGRGIDVSELGRPTNNSGQTVLDIKITGNNVNPQDTTGFPLYAIYVGADAQGTGTSGSNVHAEIHGNTVPSSPHACDTQCNTDTGMIFYETVSGATGTHIGTLFNFSGAGATVSSEIANNNTGTSAKTCSFVNGGSLALTASPPNTVSLLWLGDHTSTETVAKDSSGMQGTGSSSNPAWLNRRLHSSTAFAAQTRFLGPKTTGGRRQESRESIDCLDSSAAIAGISPSSLPTNKIASNHHAAAVTTSHRPLANHLSSTSPTADHKPSAPQSGGTVNLSVGTIPAGGTAVLTFQVTVNNTAPSGASQISNQGTVSGTSFPSVLTDDPDTVAANDATITPLLHPTASGAVITGRITDSEGKPVEGTVVNLSGTQTRKTITDANGFYRFKDVDTGGFYTVTPSRVNYNFNPFNRSFSQIGNQTEALFEGAFTGDAANPLDTAEYFVRQQYVDILNREPDEAGFNYWSDHILACGNDAACIRSERTGVAAAFFIEQEFRQSGAFIYDVYESALSRRPAYNEYKVDRSQVVGGPTLDAQKRLFAESFVARAEFVTRYENNLTAESFVDALLANAQAAGINLSSQRDSLIAHYNTGTSLTESRAFVVRDVSESTPVQEANYNPAFVVVEYFGYLQRNPEPDGYAFWLNVLNNGDPGNYRGMVCSFITSAEYQHRFSSVVSHGNSECGP